MVVVVGIASKQASHDPGLPLLEKDSTIKPSLAKGLGAATSQQTLSYNGDPVLILT